MVIALHSGNTQEPLSSNGHAVVRQPGRHPPHHRQLFLQMTFHRKQWFITALLLHALSVENCTLAITKKMKDAINNFVSHYRHSLNESFSSSSEGDSRWTV